MLRMVRLRNESPERLRHGPGEAQEGQKWPKKAQKWPKPPQGTGHFPQDLFQPGLKFGASLRSPTGGGGGGGGVGFFCGGGGGEDLGKQIEHLAARGVLDSYT